MTRTADPVDRRVKRVFLTKQANRFLRRLRGETDVFNVKILKGIDRADLQTTSDTLLAMKRSLMAMAGNNISAPKEDRKTECKKPKPRRPTAKLVEGMKSACFEIIWQNEMKNTAVILRSRPGGIAQAENFSIEEMPVAAPEPGQIVVRNAFLSVEPAMRGWIADAGNYSAPVPIGSVMRSLAVGHVGESRNPDFREGDAVAGWFGWQHYATVKTEAVVRRVKETDLPISLSLGVLGINGVTAHLALTLIGEPKVGETVLVSTSAGAVGSAVGQIAKILGCRTVGIAGGRDKVSALPRGIRLRCRA